MAKGRCSGAPSPAPPAPSYGTAARGSKPRAASGPAAAVPGFRISRASSASGAPPRAHRGLSPAPCGGGDWRAAPPPDAVRVRRTSPCHVARRSCAQTMPGRHARASNLRTCAAAPAVAKSAPPVVIRMGPHGSGVEHSLGKGVRFRVISITWRRVSRIFPELRPAGRRRGRSLRDRPSRSAIPTGPTSSRRPPSAP